MAANRDQAQYEQDQVHNDAVKEQILDVLKADGAQFAGTIAKKIDQPVNYVTQMLHELEDKFEVEFKWTRGYMV